MGSLPVSITVEMFYNDMWNDVTHEVRGMPSDGFGIDIRRGRSDEEQDVDFGSCTMTINNRNGRFSPQNPRSPLYGLIGRNTQLRVTVEDSIRFVGEIIEWPIRWDQYGKDVYLPLQAVGILRRLTSGSKPIESALRRHYLSIPQLTAYIPLEEPPDTFRDAANLVPGQVGSRYVTSLGRRPGFGEGPHPEGSAPLPEWEPIEYFGWSRGASAIIPGPTGWWGVQVTVMVPPGSGETWLGEWILDSGTYPWMALKTNSSGVIQVFGSDQGDPSPNTFTNTYSFLGEIDDGEWKTITVVGERNTNNTLMNFTVSVSGVPGTSGIAQFGGMGNLEQIRPRPMFADPTGKEQLGFGHMATFAEYVPNGAITTFRSNLLGGDLRPPVTGFAGESAVNRIRRLALEHEVNIQIDYHVRVRDTFERTEVSSWGTADTGQVWNELGTASDYNVNNGEGQIVGPPAGTHLATVPIGLDNGEVLVRAGVSGLGAGAVVEARRDGSDSYQFFLSVASDGNTTYGITGAAAQARLDNANDRGWTPDTRWWIRVEAVENRLQMKAWYDGDPEPTNWFVSIVDNALETGDWGLGAISSLGNTVLFDDLTIWEACPSTLMGPQQIDTLVNNMRQAQDADHGILYETREVLGLAYVPLCSLYNQEATLELDYEACHLGHPLHPDQDDRFLANDVTVQRIGGTSARVVKEVGPLSILPPPDGVGTYDRDESLNLFDDDQVEDHAGWLVHIGTWPEARYSLIRIRNQAPQSCELDPHFAEQAAAVDTGKVITIENPPIWLPPENIRALTQGYEEVIDLYKWLFRFNTSPANPYIIGLWDEQGDSPGLLGPADSKRYDTCGSESVDPFEAGVDTALEVVADPGPLWSTTATFPLDIQAAGSRLRVTAIGEPSDPQLQSTSNHSWFADPNATIPAPAGDLSGRILILVQGSDIVIRPAGSPLGGTPWQSLVEQRAVDGTGGYLRVWWKIGGPNEPTDYGLLGNSGAAVIVALTDGFPGVPLAAGQRVVGNTATIPTPSTTPGARNLDLRVAFTIGHTSTTPPAGWTTLIEEPGPGFRVAIAAQALPAGATGSQNWTTTGTSTGVAGATLNVLSMGPQTFTIQQAPVNGIEKTIPAGTPISLWQPARYAL